MQNTNTSHRQRAATIKMIGIASVFRYKKIFQRRHRIKQLSYLFGCVFALVLSIFIQSLGPVALQRQYELQDTARMLVGESRDDTKEHLTMNDEGTAYSFAVPETEVEVGGENDHTGRVEDAFSAQFSVNPEDGISVTESSSKVAVTLVPKFHTLSGQKVEGDHVVYPAGADKLVYTLKYNGLKEDIIVPKARGDKLSYDFALRLPAGVEARLDQQGNIGIYSGDLSLYGNISFGSDEDRAQVEKARENANKNQLLMTIPFPIVKDALGNEYTDRAQFYLSEKKRVEQKETRSDLPADIPRQLVTHNEYTLTLSAQKLQDLSYPISLDPTISVANAGDFAGVVTEGGVNIDEANGVIERTGLTGGAVGSWTSTTSLSTAVREHSIVVANGYVYVVGGDTGASIITTVQYAQINSNGTLGSWSTTTALPEGRQLSTAVVHGNYMYVVGGSTTGGTRRNTVYYARINENGTLRSWNTTTTVPTALDEHVAAAYNNYLYIASGAPSTEYAAVRYAPIYADGSIGSWTSTSSLNTSRRNGGGGFYQGTFYVAGGDNGSGTKLSSVEYAKQNSDGSLSSWTTTNSMGTAREGLGVSFYGGYIYAVGGGTGSNSAVIEYAPVFADGSLDRWSTTTSLGTATNYAMSMTYNGKLYRLGGAQGGVVSSTEYATITSPGNPSNSWTSTSQMSGDARYRSLHCSVALNGYMYTFGGRRDSNANAQLSDSLYAPINADGTIGSWSSTSSSLPEARRSLRCETVAGYIYLMAGRTNGNNNGDNVVYYAQPNSSGNITSFTSTSSLNNARQSHSSFVYGDWIYVLGGNSPGGRLDDIERAQVQSNGTLSSWQNDGTNLPTTLESIAAIASGGYAYFVGGYDGSSFYDETYYATINSDGTLGSFTATSLMLDELYDVQLNQWNGYIYSVGGYDGSTRVNTAMYAKTNSDGTLSSWQSMINIPNAVSGHQMAIYSGYMYILGGDLGGDYIDNVDFIPLQNGGRGSLASSWTSTTAFTTARNGHASIAYNGYLYVLGGNELNNVQYAAISEVGTVGSWSSTSSFTTGRSAHDAVAYDGYMYILGGESNSGSTAHNDVQYASINSDGTLSSWSSTTSFTTARRHLQAFASNGYVYVAGGANGSSTQLSNVQYAAIASNGTVGSWTSTTSLPAAVINHAMVVNGGYVYTMGGYSGTSYLRDVHFAVLNSDGTVGTWKKTMPLPDSVRDLTAFSHNGFLYVSGGENSGGNVSSVYVTSVHVNGTAADWQKTTSLPTARRNHATAVFKGRVFLLGGYDTANSAAVHSAGLQSISRQGRLTLTYDFESGAKPAYLITRGTAQTNGAMRVLYDSNVTCGASAYSNPIFLGVAGLGGANREATSLGTNRTLARCLRVQYLIDDAQAAVFPETTDGSSVSGIDMYYTPGPGNRLRNGRSFTNGMDRGLDANPL